MPSYNSEQYLAVYWRQIMADNGRYSANDNLLAVALATGQSVRDAAAAVGISERTTYRRVADTDFQGLMRQLRGEMVTTAIGKLSSSMANAAEVLGELLKDKDANFRYKAAVKLLEIGFKADEHARLEAEIAELKAMVSTKIEGGPS